MSTIVKTVTPFINKTLLLKALDAVGCKYTEQGNRIVLCDRVDGRGNQVFSFVNGKYVLSHDSDEWIRNGLFGFLNFWGNDRKEYVPVSEFVKQVEKSYNEIYEKQRKEAEERLRKLEEERRRLEEERLKKAQEEAERERVRKEQEKIEEERRRLEEERIRIERERQEYVEKQRRTVIENAKKQGYAVREERVKNKIKLVMVRSC